LRDNRRDRSRPRSVLVLAEPGHRHVPVQRAVVLAIHNPYIVAYARTARFSHSRTVAGGSEANRLSPSQAGGAAPEPGPGPWPIASSASQSPISGPNLKPCPEVPHPITTSPIRSMMKLVSGELS